MERKAQQQTLSIRISETLREFLERSKQVISNGRGENVSTSDVAKILLESAKDDRLDFRLEVADLQRSPTEALAGLRRKWDQQQDLSRAEWIFLAQYIQVACEELTENPAMPSPSAFIGLLDALLAVRGLRADRGAGLDRYYLGNLGVPDSAAFNERQFDPDLVPKVVTSLIQGLRDSSTAKKPVFSGRNFYVALRDEELNDMVALNRVLEPQLTTLFTLAARGHWIRERRPVRTNRRRPVSTPAVSLAVEGSLRLTALVNPEGEVEMSLAMDARGAIYPIGPYPEIQEFGAMLQHVEPGRAWDGVHFHASANVVDPVQDVQFQFRRHSDGVTFTFPEEEWKGLSRLSASLMAEPRLQPVFAELALVYGEL